MTASCTYFVPDILLNAYTSISMCIFPLLEMIVELNNFLPESLVAAIAIKIAISLGHIFLLPVQ